MICPLCHGLGRVVYRQRSGYHRKTFEWSELCPDCMGSGVTYCCQGECAQPDAEPEAGTEQ